MRTLMYLSIGLILLVMSSCSSQQGIAGADNYDGIYNDQGSTAYAAGPQQAVAVQQPNNDSTGGASNNNDYYNPGYTNNYVNPGYDPYQFGMGYDMGYPLWGDPYTFTPYYGIGFGLGYGFGCGFGLGMYDPFWAYDDPYWGYGGYGGYGCYGGGYYNGCYGNNYYGNEGNNYYYGPRQSTAGNTIIPARSIASSHNYYAGSSISKASSDRMIPFNSSLNTAANVANRNTTATKATPVHTADGGGNFIHFTNPVTRTYASTGQSNRPVATYMHNNNRPAGTASNYNRYNNTQYRYSRPGAGSSNPGRLYSNQRYTAGNNTQRSYSRYAGNYNRGTSYRPSYSGYGFNNNRSSYSGYSGGYHSSGSFGGGFHSLGGFGGGGMHSSGGFGGGGGGSHSGGGGGGRR